MDFLKALRGEPTSQTPIWLMRQAGRYMASYRALRAKYSLLDLVKTPELACEVTLQPIKAFNLDAAIIFSDILPILEALGLKLEFVHGEGPVLHDPIREPRKLTTRPLEESIGFTLEAIKLVKPELKVPLIGFSGSPFTLACYAIEGGSSKDHRLAKTFMYQNPAAWHELMTTMADLVAEYLVKQAEAGADVLQIFDSWAGSLSGPDFERYVLPYTQYIISSLRATRSNPVIYFSTGTGGYLDIVNQLGADAYSIDWRVSVSQAHHIFNKPIQGNLDPMVLLAPQEEIGRQASLILQNAPQTGFIFNLGHGILQQTPEDHVKFLIEHIRNPS